MFALAKRIIRISVDLLIIQDFSSPVFPVFFLINPRLISRQLYNENFHEVSVMLIGEVSLQEKIAEKINCAVRRNRTQTE